MTIVGKILVFVNLVFSLIVGGLVIVVFATRANWQDAFAKQKALYEAADADRRQLVADLKAAKQQYDDAMTARTRERDDALTARDTAKKEATTAVAELNEIKKKQDALSADNTAVLAATGLRTEQVKELVVNLAKARDDLRIQTRKTELEKALRVRAQIDAKTFQAQAEKLEGEVRELAKDLARKQLGPGTTTVVARKRGEDNPPAENVQGKIVSTDPTGDLVRISVGSDAGLQPKHTLKVYRLDPIPENSKYLGTIEILSVRPHEAVGRPVKRPAFPLRAGDRVAARISIGGS
jgi:hypothetical protein